MQTIIIYFITPLDHNPSVQKHFEDQVRIVYPNHRHDDLRYPDLDEHKVAFKLCTYDAQAIYAQIPKIPQPYQNQAEIIEALKQCPFVCNSAQNLNSQNNDTEFVCAAPDWECHLIAEALKAKVKNPDQIFDLHDYRKWIAKLYKTQNINFLPSMFWPNGSLVDNLLQQHFSYQHDTKLLYYLNQMQAQLLPNFDPAAFKERSTMWFYFNPSYVAPKFPHRLQIADPENSSILHTLKRADFARIILELIQAMPPGIMIVDSLTWFFYDLSFREDLLEDYHDPRYLATIGCSDSHRELNFVGSTTMVIHAKNDPEYPEIAALYEHYADRIEQNDLRARHEEQFFPPIDLFGKIDDWTVKVSKAPDRYPQSWLTEHLHFYLSLFFRSYLPEKLGFLPIGTAI